MASRDRGRFHLSPNMGFSEKPHGGRTDAQQEAVRTTEQGRPPNQEVVRTTEQGRPADHGQALTAAMEKHALREEATRVARTPRRSRVPRQRWTVSAGEAVPCVVSAQSAEVRGSTGLSSWACRDDPGG